MNNIFKCISILLTDEDTREQKCFTCYPRSLVLQNSMKGKWLLKGQHYSGMCIYKEKKEGERIREHPYNTSHLILAPGWVVGWGGWV